MLDQQCMCFQSSNYTKKILNHFNDHIRKEISFKYIIYLSSVTMSLLIQKLFMRRIGAPPCTLSFKIKLESLDEINILNVLVSKDCPLHGTKLSSVTLVIFLDVWKMYIYINLLISFSERTVCSYFGNCSIFKNHMYYCQCNTL